MTDFYQDPLKATWIYPLWDDRERHSILLALEADTAGTGLGLIPASALQALRNVYCLGEHVESYQSISPEYAYRRELLTVEIRTWWDHMQRCLLEA